MHCVALILIFEASPQGQSSVRCEMILEADADFNGRFSDLLECTSDGGRRRPPGISARILLWVNSSEHFVAAHQLRTRRQRW
jgi:hypothetical protein